MGPVSVKGVSVGPVVLVESLADALHRWESRIIPAMALCGVNLGLDNAVSVQEGAGR